VIEPGRLVLIALGVSAENDSNEADWSSGASCRATVMTLLVEIGEAAERGITR
jgi:hypothetical protein